MLRAIANQRLQPRPAVGAARIDRPRHAVQAIGVGGADHRAVVAVTQREGVGERVVVREIGARVVAHGHRAVDRVVCHVRREERVHGAAVPARVLRFPVVRDVVGAFPGAGGAVDVEWRQESSRRTEQIAPAIALIEDRQPVALDGHRTIGKAAHTAMGAEVVIE